MTSASVGVVIPAYNATGYLSQALASVAGQLVLPDEVVVVDDQSSDATSQVARSWSDRLPVRVASTTTNSGPARARDVGIEMLSTDRVALLDADDVWLPDHLSVMLATAESTGGQLVTARALRWWPGRALGRLDQPARLRVPSSDQLVQLVRRNYVFYGTLFRREDYYRAGGFGDFFGVEDWELWLRMVADGLTVAVANTPTVLYRLRPSSITASGALFEGEIAVLESVCVSPDRFPKEARAAANSRLPQLRANVALQEAYRAARAGRASRARACAAKVLLSGSWRSRLYGSALLVAPGYAVNRRDALHAEPDWEVNR